MATTENYGLLTYKDAEGNLYLLLPVTKAELVDGLEEALAERFTDAEKQKLAGIEDGANNYSLPTGGVGTEHLADGAVEAAKIAAGAVSWAKLASDARYSPFNASQNTTLAKGVVGKKIRFYHSNLDFVVNIEKGSNFPDGGEVGIFNDASKTNRIVFADGVKVALLGQSDYLNGPTLTIPEKFDTIAIEKINSDNAYEYWHVLGNVEVVS